MIKHLLVVFFFVISIGFSFSQDVYQIRQAMDLYRTNKVQSGDWKATLSENDIDGSPYLNDEFVIGTVYTTQKQKFVDVPLRYNIYLDQVEFKTPEDVIQAIATPEIVEKVDFGDYEMVYVPYSNVKKIRHAYFKVIESGNSSLFSRPEVLFKEATEPAAYKIAEPARFVKKPDSYYIKIGNGQAQKVGNKKEVIKIFPSHQNEISAFIKKNKIKTTKQDDLIKLVQHYNSL